MRVKTLLVAATLLSLALAGCLSPGEPLEQAGSDPVMDDAPDPADPDEDASSEDEEEDAPQDDASDEDDSSEEDPDPGDEAPGEDAAEDEDPADGLQDETVAVLGLIDTGINPYHEVFRDDSALAHVHPSVYIDGYPEDAQPLNLTLDADTYADALEADEDIWANVTEEQLYWIPGTRIDAAIAHSTSASHCEILGLPHEAPAASLLDTASDQVNETTGEADPFDCPDTQPILDTHGHGTMTASRAAGDGTSLCPDCRIATIEGLSSTSVDWATDAGWIDVLSNSWIDPVPAPANQAQDGSTSASVARAAQNMVTLFASGNGAAYVAGGAPTPTYTLSTAPPGVILVGAHDNGHVATWSGSPPHVIADGFKSLAAERDSLTSTGPLAFACCTSSAAPYAAGAAAQLVHDAREALDDRSNGMSNGSLAQGSASLVHAGPLADGNLTLDELRRVLFTTAQLPPQQGPHDGDAHWTADPSNPPVGSTNPAQNPYCGLCWTTPIPYEEIPEDVPPYAYTGYGAITPASLEASLDVLAGSMEEPARDDADAFYELDQSARELYYPTG